MNGNQITNATIAQTTESTAPCQLAVAMKPFKPIGVGQGCCTMILGTRCEVTAMYPTIPEARGAQINGTNKLKLYTIGKTNKRSTLKLKMDETNSTLPISCSCAQREPKKNQIAIPKVAQNLQ